MQIKYSPQLSGVYEIEYSFNGWEITATFKGVTDVFDFTGMPEGELDIFTVETSLEFNPITSAEVKNGELYVGLIKFIHIDATDEECFPTWQEV